MMLRERSTGNYVPMMAHPSRWNPEPPSDLTFSDFLERCIADGTRHLKLDFKHANAVEPCLQLLSKRWKELYTNGQAVWLNADVLPGPNARGKPPISANEFVSLSRRYCPHAVLSLGWCVGPIGPEERYTHYDMEEMTKLCHMHGLPGSAITFAVSLRLAERALADVASILKLVPESQLLLWTGTGEAPVRPGVYARAQSTLARLGVSERVGFDVAIAKTCLQSGQAEAVDCTFWWSRWTRYFCCGQLGTDYLLLAHRDAGEHTPLFDPASNTPTTTPDAKAVRAAQAAAAAGSREAPGKPAPIPRQ